MLQKTRGIVLSSVKFSETSIICKVFTEAMGLRSYIVSGVRAHKSIHKPALLQPLSLLEMVAYESNQKKVHRLKEFKLAKVFQELPFDIIKSTVGLFTTEILAKTLEKEEEANPILFKFAYDNICFLEETKENLGNFPIYFLLELSRYLGIYPDNNYSKERKGFDMKEGRFTAEPIPFLESPKEHETLSKEFSLILGQPREVVLKHPLSIEHRRALLNFLLRYYVHHIPSFGDVQSISILQEILS